MFGKSILVEEVNHIVSHSISDYIRELPLFGINDPIGRLPYGGLKVSF